MRRALLCALALAALGGCARPDGARDRAAHFVVEHLRTRVAEPLTPYLATEWQIFRASETEPIPGALLEELQARAGLPLIPDSLVQRRDSTVIVLYLFRPEVIRPDSVRALGGWMGFTGGDGGSFWAYEYDFTLDCRAECTLRAPPGMSILN